MQAPPTDSWKWIAPESWARELRHAARSLSRTPGFSLAVFCSLALCIGPNAATLSVLYSLVLKPLPFPAPAQLITVVNVGDKSGGQQVSSSTPQYVDFKANADRNVFSGFAAIRRDEATLDDDNAPVRVPIVSVAGDFFGLVGVQPVLGRFFTADNEIAGRDHVLVISQNIWESRDHSDPAVIGSQVRIVGQLYTIIGVAPRSLESVCYQTHFFRPYVPPASKFDPQARFRGDLDLYARLKPGVSLRAARAELAGLEANFLLRVATPQMRDFIANAGFRLAVEPLHTGGTSRETEALWLLQGGALLVLLIGCANVVNLFLGRMIARRAELSIRAALGASYAALLRQTLAESLMLTGTAVVAGIVFALAALHLFNRYLPVVLPGMPPVSFDAAITGTMVVIASGIAFLVGFLPLQLVWRGGLHLGAARTASSGRGARAFSGLMVTAQVAIAVMLLVGASLLLRSFANVMSVQPGFDAENVVQGRIALPARYNSEVTRLGMQRRVVAAMKGIPGVENVAIMLSTALLANERPVPFSVRGAPDTGAESQPLIHIDAVSPDFFSTMGMRVVSGRGFNEADDTHHPVAIVDDTFVQRYFSGRLVEGQEIYLSRAYPMGVDAWPRVVGVVSRANFTGLDSHDNLPFVYVCTAGYPAGSFNVLVRSHRPGPEILHEMRTKLREIDSSVPLYSTGSLEGELDHLLMPRRGITLLLALFSGLALVLAAIGLYGVLSYDVSQRTREIGIRGAIGASRRQIVGLIMRQGMAKTAAGLIVGSLGAIFLTRYLSTLLFGIIAADGVSYLAVVALLAGVSALACWLPARRAAKVDPIVALRAE